MRAFFSRYFLSQIISQLVPSLAISWTFSNERISSALPSAPKIIMCKRKAPRSAFPVILCHGGKHIFYFAVCLLLPRLDKIRRIVAINLFPFYVVSKGKETILILVKLLSSLLKRLSFLRPFFKLTRFYF